MNHLKKTHGRVIVVAFVAAAGLFASAAPGLAAEQPDPVAPLAASQPVAQPAPAEPTTAAAPTDDDPDDESEGDPDDASSGGGWSDKNTNATSDDPDGSDEGDANSDANSDYSDSDEDSDEDSTPEHFGSSEQTKAEKAAAERAAKKAKALQKKANNKDKAAKKKAKAAAAKKMKKAAMKAAKRAAAQRAAEKRSAQQQRRAIADDDDDSDRPRSGGSLDSMRDAILDLTNRARKSAGCGTLRYSTQLEKSAQWMANDMSEHHYMSHNDRQGRNSDKRIRGTGFRGDKTGENLGEGFDSPEAVFKAWMGSPSHRRNILDCGFRILGVGFASSGGYWAQHFGG